MRGLEIVTNRRGLRLVLLAYIEHYLKSRTPLSLDNDSPWVTLRDLFTARAALRDRRRTECQQLQ
jgi:hypothetical protein